MSVQYAYGYTPFQFPFFLTRIKIVIAALPKKEQTRSGTNDDLANLQVKMIR